MEQFSKIKQRIKRNAFLRSGVLGGGIAVAAVCIPVIVFAILEKDVPWLWVVSGGVLLGALVFGILLLCLYPFKKRLARRLDKTLGGEKTQTMVEFSESDDAMSLLQRKDTEERLGNIPETEFKFKHAWQCIAAGSLAIVTLAGALLATFLPQGDMGGGAVPPGHENQEDEAFEVTEYQLAGLRQLIDDVKSSAMAQGLKESAAKKLEDLMAQLPQLTTREEMVELVAALMVEVDQEVEAVNCGYDLATAMTQVGQPLVERLGNAVGSVELDRFQDFYLECAEGFKPFTETVEDDSQEGEGEAKTARADTSETPDESEPPEKGGLAKKNITQFSVALATALAASKVDENVPLYKAVKDLHTDINTLALAIKYFEETLWVEQVDKVFAENTEAFINALNAEISNDETRDYIVRKLKEIFALEEEEMPILSRDFVPTHSETEEENDDEMNSGGLGTGDYNFPSDELVYNPATGEQIRYGELLAEYYNRYTEALQNGEIDAETEALLQAYFDMLSATKKDQTE